MAPFRRIVGCLGLAGPLIACGGGSSVAPDASPDAAPVCQTWCVDSIPPSGAFYGRNSTPVGRNSVGRNSTPVRALAHGVMMTPSSMDVNVG